MKCQLKRLIKYNFIPTIEPNHNQHPQIGIEQIINEALGVDEREIVSPDQIVKAITLYSPIR